MTELSPRTLRMIETQIVPAAANPIMADSETPRGPAPDYRGMVERVDEASTGAARNHDVVAIQPTQSVAVAPPAEPAAPSQERTVHVRIGAIEIYPADTRANAQAPAVAAPVLAAAPSSVPAGGFDEFAALRRYTPWTW